MKLSEWLSREGIKRKDFAEMVGVSPSLVTQLCDGTVWPGRGVVERIIKATNGEVTADSFVARAAADKANDPPALKASAA